MTGAPRCHERTTPAWAGFSNAEEHSKGLRVLLQRSATLGVLVKRAGTSPLVFAPSGVGAKAPTRLSYADAMPTRVASGTSTSVPVRTS
jgi:hypothetical protein